MFTSGTNDAYIVHSHVAILLVFTSVTNALAQIYDPIILPNSISRKTLPKKLVNAISDK
jgi:hypothetical protein